MAGKKFEFSTRPLGEILATDFLTPKKMSRETLSEALEIESETCAAILDGRASISGDVAIKLSELFDNTPEYWMNIQMERDLDEARWRKFQQKTRFYFLHIKKCVGTTLIGLANNQENVRFHHPHANGNPAHDDPSLPGEKRYIRYWEFDQKKHKEFLYNDDYNFIANEVHLGDEFDHYPDLVYFTILRDPVKRALSQFYHMRHLNDKIDTSVDNFLKDKSENAKVFNNYMAFQITGKVVRNYDEDVVAEAIKRLEKFDHILFQETFAEDIAEFTDYGWDTNLMSDRNVRSKTQKDNPSTETLEKLAERLSTDQAIYDYFWKKRNTTKKSKNVSALASAQSYISKTTLFYQDKWESEISELQELQKAQKKTNIELRMQNAEKNKKFEARVLEVVALKEAQKLLKKKTAEQAKANQLLLKERTEQHKKDIATLKEAQKVQREKTAEQAKSNQALRQRLADQHKKHKETAKLSVAKQEKIKALHEENKSLKQQISAMNNQK